MPPRLCRKLPSLKISAEGREIRDQTATYAYSTAARVVCTAVAAVMELRMYCQRCYVRYVLRTVSTSAAQRATYTCVFYSRTCDMYSRSSVAAVMVLRMYCRRCYVRYVLLTVSTAAAAVVLPSYAATLWVIATPYTPRVLINKPWQHPGESPTYILHKDKTEHIFL